MGLLGHITLMDAGFILGVYFAGILSGFALLRVVMFQGPEQQPPAQESSSSRSRK